MMTYTYKKRYPFPKVGLTSASQADISWCTREFGPPNIWAFSQGDLCRWRYILQERSYSLGYFYLTYSFVHSDDYVKFVLSCG